MFRSIHLALPVQDLDKSIAFFQTLFSAKVIAKDLEKRHCTVAYQGFEYSLFEVARSFVWHKKELGPFHIGHELCCRSAVDKVYELAVENAYDIACAPFDRNDGDYAFFVRDSQGILFEFFHGSHHLARARFECRD